jgi:polyhydroxyalkanoate synthesis regulator phasin
MAERDLTLRDMVERGLMAGIGMLSLTREKAQTVVDELVNRGEVKRDESTGLVDRLVQRGEDERTHFRKLVRDELGKAAHELNLATKADLQALAKKIDALSQKPQG